VLGVMWMLWTLWTLRLLGGGSGTIKSHKIQDIRQRIGETRPPKIPHTRAHSRAKYDVEFVDAWAFPGGPAVAGDARRVAARTIKNNRNDYLL
jgi:hypothetical protein